MQGPTQPRRPPAPCTLTALEVFAAIGERRVRRGDFELRMNQRGCDAREVLRAVISLERRGWATATASSVELSDEGWRAAIDGVALPTAKKRPRRRERMPVGLL